MEKKKKTGKYVRNLLLFGFLVWLTFYVLLRDQNMGELFEILKGVKLPFVFLGIGCMVVYFLCESFNLKRTLRALGENITIKNTIKYSLIGFFFSSITPAATGGQPMQVYYMHKDGVKAAHSTLALVVNLWSFQITTISMALISVIFFHNYLDVGLVFLFITGILLNSIALSLLIIGIFSKKLSTGLVNITIKIMKKLKIRHLDEKEESLKAALEKYNGSAKYIRGNKKIVIRQFLITFIQEVVYYSIPFCVFKSFDLGGANYIKMVCLQSIVYATVSGIPSPGAVGISEGAFVSIYKSIFTDKLINGAMLLNRGISFYLFVFICAIVVIVNTFKDKKEQKLNKSDDSI